MLLDVLQGQVVRPAPLWMMRQAGRTLPAYRKIRENFPSFFDLVFHAEAAAEVTQLPIHEFPLLDAAILFSDILVVPYALGQKVTFVEGEGPSLAPLELEKMSFSFESEPFQACLAPVFETVSRVRKTLPSSKTLIGFAGSPWTVAAYMIEGQGTRDFLKAKNFAFSSPVLFQKLLNWITDATIFYLKGQIRAGAQAIQLFDSWTGVVPAQQYQEWIEYPTKRLIKEIKKEFPYIPFIGFPRGLGALVPTYTIGTGVDAVSLDSSYPLEKARDLPCVIQGNLDPVALLVGGKALRHGVENIYYFLKGLPFIFNLGHGVLPSTPLTHIREFIHLVKERVES